MGKKKGDHEEHVNHERWLVSYADFITLLFAFFVVMYAISDLNSRKAKQVSDSVRFAMHFEGSGGTNDAGFFNGVRRIDRNEMKSGGAVGNLDQWIRESTTVYEFLLKDMAEDFQAGNDARHQLDERGVVLTLPVKWLFDPGTARPTDKANKFLGKIEEAARRYHKDILISGTTSRVKLPAGGEFRDTIDLQLKRLSTLERTLIETMRWPAERVSITSVTQRSIAGELASAAQVERSSVIELILMR